MKPLFCVLLSASVSALAAQNLVDNGSFEHPPGFNGFLYNGQRAGNWTVHGHSVYLTGSWQPADGHAMLELNGASPSSVYQDLATRPHRYYQLRFAMAGNPHSGHPIKTMDVAFGDEGSIHESFDTTGKSFSNMGWEYRSYIVYAAHDHTRLSFTSTSAGYIAGPTIDDVSVTVLRSGDVNGDGCVDDHDLSQVIHAFGTHQTGPVDQHRDGIIDDADLAIVLELFGTGC